MRECAQLTQLEWQPLIQKAFRLGWEHGSQSSTPLTADELKQIVLDGYVRRNIDKRKLRQVYGAGFDLGARYE